VSNNPDGNQIQSVGLHFTNNATHQNSRFERRDEAMIDQLFELNVARFSAKDGLPRHDLLQYIFPSNIWLSLSSCYIPHHPHLNL
jgi:hypothetical protein